MMHRCLSILILLLGATLARATEPYVPVDATGEFGTGPGQLNFPFDVTVVGQTLYIADSNNNRVQIYDLGLNLLDSFGGSGSTDGKFARDRGIGRTHRSVLSQKLLVTDAKNDRVQRFNLLGVHEDTWGTIGDGELEFFRPRGIEGAPDGSLVICDTDNHRMKIYNDDLSIRAIFGSRGGGNNKFIAPFDCAVDDDGLVYITDLGNAVVKVFDLDGQFQRKWGSYGVGDGEFVAPEAIAVSPDGKIFVSDRSDESFTIERIQIFTSEGGFLGSFGSVGSGPGQLQRVTGMSFDDEGRLYVAEANNHRVSVWEPAAVRTEQRSVSSLKALFTPH